MEVSLFLGIIKVSMFCVLHLNVLIPCERKTSGSSFGLTNIKFEKEILGGKLSITTF